MLARPIRLAVHGVTHDGVVGAPVGSDIADQHVARVDADADGRRLAAVVPQVSACQGVGAAQGRPAIIGFRVGYWTVTVAVTLMLVQGEHMEVVLMKPSTGSGRGATSTSQRFSTAGRRSQPEVNSCVIAPNGTVTLSYVDPT